jgi:hypothetical protein
MQLLRILRLLALAGLGSSFVAGASARADTPDPRRSYDLLRDDENWSWLRGEHADADFWDPLKYARLSKTRDDVYLTVGGETRQWLESYRNEQWGKTGYEHNTYWLQRYMLHADAHLTPYFRLFAQAKSGLEVGRLGGPRPIDKDELDFNQLYIDAIAIPGKILDDEPHLLARIGRQEMSYGSGRLIDVREGPNVRFGYDGARIIGREGPLRIDAFAVRPDLTNPGVLDDGWDRHQAFWGAWATWNRKPILIDAYYLGLERDSFKYQRVSGQEWRHTTGARVRASFDPVSAEVEAAYQFGEVGTTRISAWTVASDLVARGASLPLEPVATVGIGATSGDSGPSSSTLGTFSPLFPRGAYFGLVSANGPANNVSPHVSLAVTAPRGLSASIEGWAFWRESLNDGVYSVPGTLLRTGTTAQGRFLGSQVEGYVSWQVDGHLSLNTTLAYFVTGSYFDTSSPGLNTTYGAAWATYKF